MKKKEVLGERNYSAITANSKSEMVVFIGLLKRQDN